MKWVSAVSENRLLQYAVAECASEIESALDGQTPDLAVAFASVHHSAHYDELPGLVRELLGPRLLMGCSGGGIIGAGREVENRPGFSLAAAVLPNTRFVGFRTRRRRPPRRRCPTLRVGGHRERCRVRRPPVPTALGPLQRARRASVDGLRLRLPRSAKIGGMASGGQTPGSNALYLGDATYNDGVVGVALHGDVAVDTIVAQGCRPIGRRMQITSSESNILLELDGRNTMDVLRELFQNLDERDSQLAQHSLFLGVVMDEFNDDPKLGDFLIRNIIGLDARRGALAVGEHLKEGQTVQFHLRDAETSSQDLDAMLTQYTADGVQASGAGALLFQCLGRGSYLYGRPTTTPICSETRSARSRLRGFSATERSARSRARHTCTVTRARSASSGRRHPCDRPLLKIAPSFISPRSAASATPRTPTPATRRPRAIRPPARAER